MKAALLLAFFASGAAALRQPFDYYKGLESFLQTLASPKAIDLTASPVFDKKVIGRVDVSETNLTGRQLNSEYIFGLFTAIAQDTTSTSLLGPFMNQTVQSVVIEPPMVYTSVVAEAYFGSIGVKVPIQIDLTIEFSDDILIQSYDVVFRRWPEAWEYIVPRLAPQLAKELNQTYVAGTTNDTALVVERAAIDICQSAMQYCVGENAQYSSNAECVAYITEQMPWGNVWEGGSDNGFCRYINHNLVAYRPDFHCPSLGPSGGQMCIDRDYVATATSFPFKSTFIAPQSKVLESDMAGLSESSVQGLLEASLQTDVWTTIAFYPIPTLVFFFLLYANAKLVYAVLLQRSREFRKLSFENRRNTVTYVLNTVYTTIGLGFQLPIISSFGGEYTFRGIQCLKITGVMVVALYLFELIYRPSMRLPLLVHHICTIFAITSVFVSVQYTNHPSVITIGGIWLWQATSEQSIFIALFMYRLRYRASVVTKILKFSAVQSFLFKFGFAVYLIVYWGMHVAKYHSNPVDIYFSVVVCTIAILLMATQIYGAWAVWSIAQKLNRDTELSPSNTLHPSPQEKSDEFVSDAESPGVEKEKALSPFASPALAVATERHTLSYA
ncbi:hypothetical protein MNV49_002014 [Pseudohyphozyma bogoriensis]|nr:hypothetical protein MNV49_002014 [Pseudohyphozyma bogoriensis]